MAVQHTNAKRIDAENTAMHTRLHTQLFAGCRCDKCDAVTMMTTVHRGATLLPRKLASTRHGSWLHAMQRL